MTKKRKKTLADLAYTASERYVCCFYGENWRHRKDARYLAGKADGYFRGYLAGRRAERRAMKRKEND